MKGLPAVLGARIEAAGTCPADFREESTNAANKFFPLAVGFLSSNRMYDRWTRGPWRSRTRLPSDDPKGANHKSEWTGDLSERTYPDGRSHCVPTLAILVRVVCGLGRKTVTHTAGASLLRPIVRKKRDMSWKQSSSTLSTGYFSLAWATGWNLQLRSRPEKWRTC